MSDIISTEFGFKLVSEVWLFILLSPLWIKKYVHLILQDTTDNLFWCFQKLLDFWNVENFEDFGDFQELDTIFYYDISMSL